MRSATLFRAFVLLILATTSGALFADDETQLSREQIYENFKSAYSSGDWETARDWAGRLIEAKERDLGPDSPDLIISIINRAGVDLEVQDWESAQKYTARGVAILNKQPDDNLSQRIALVLTNARAQLGLRDEKMARKTLFEALRLNKKTAPVDKWTEADIYQLLVDAAKQDADQRDGNQAITKSLAARAEYFGDDTLQMAPYYQDAARWYRFSTQLAKERKQHEKTIALLEAKYGKDDIRLATPLMGIAETYTIPHKSPKKIEAALNRALSLKYPDSPDATLIRARVLVKLANYHVVFDNPGSGIDLYRDAWHVLADHQEFGTTTANRYFSEPQRLYFKQPDNPASTGKGADFFSEGFVELGFDVGRNGRLENVKILKSKPLQMREKLFFDAAQKARFRPRVVDGEPVATLNQRFTFTYSFTDR